MVVSTPQPYLSVCPKCRAQATAYSGVTIYQCVKCGELFTDFTVLEGKKNNPVIDKLWNGG